MNLIEAVTAAQILTGAAIMLLSIAISLKIKHNVSENLRIRWIISLSLMVFFFFGYNLLVIILLLEVAFRLEIVTGTVFLGGAVFVYLVMKLTQVTLHDITKKDKDVRLYADGLSKRTKELEKEIAERKSAENALKMSEEQYRSLVESTDDSIYVVDREYKYIFMNQKHISRMGFAGGEYAGRSYSEFHPEDETQWFKEKASHVMKTGESIVHENRGMEDGRYFLLTLSPVKATNGEIEAVTVISKEITDYKLMEHELRTLSLTDQLTGILNRRGFLTLAEQLLKQAKRQKRGLYMLYVDLDNLKGINDQWGHHTGDIALIHTANMLKENYRESDIIARIGGDEFVVLPAGKAGDNFDSIIHRLDEAVDLKNAQGGREFTLSLSAGISYFNPTNPCTIEELLVLGDRSMYEKKKIKQRDAG